MANRPVFGDVGRYFATWLASRGDKDESATRLLLGLWVRVLAIFAIVGGLVWLLQRATG